MDGKMNEEKLVGPKEPAEILNVPISWIYQRTRLGIEAILHLRVGKYRRFNMKEVKEFLSGKDR